MTGHRSDRRCGALPPWSAKRCCGRSPLAARRSSCSSATCWVMPPSPTNSSSASRIPRVIASPTWSRIDSPIFSASRQPFGTDPPYSSVRLRSPAIRGWQLPWSCRAGTRVSPGRPDGLGARPSDRNPNRRQGGTSAGHCPARGRGRRCWLGVGFLGWGRASDVGVAVSLRLGAEFIDQAGEGGADVEVVDLAKRVEADPSGPVDGNQARCAP